MSFSRVYILFLFGLYFSPILSGQGAIETTTTERFRFEHFDKTDGVSKVGGYAPGRTLEDKEGFIWWSTMDGLLRFDGHSFKQFRYSSDNPFGLGSNQTSGICQDDDGNIWIGTGSEGIYIFDPSTGRFSSMRADPSDNNSISSDDVHMLAKDKEGNIWMGTRSTGVCKYNPQTKIVKHYNNLSDGLAFLQQKDGSIWIGYSYGMAKYHPSLDSLITFPVDKNNIGLWQYNRVFGLAEDANGKIWLGSGDYETKIYDVSKEIFSNANLPTSALPRSVTADREGNIWLGGDIEALLYYNTREQQWHVIKHDIQDPQSCPLGSKSDLFFDSHENLWLLVSGQGISKLISKKNLLNV